MKKFILLTTYCILSISLFAQVPTTGTAGGINNINFWARGGNVMPDGNIFGTRYNSAIYTITGGIAPGNFRMKLNGDFMAGTQYLIGGYSGLPMGGSVNTSGYLFLGHADTYSNLLFTTGGAYSLLHLNGSQGTFVQNGGYRPWMKTGVTFTDNNDLSYFGLRRIGNTTDITETVLAFSDNWGNNAAAPDEFAIRFTSGTGSLLTSGNKRTQTDYDGLHIARFTPDGFMALGNTFGANPTGSLFYSRPMSLFHMSYDRVNGAGSQPYGFMQITYQDTVNPNLIGVKETAEDGLRFGIDNTIQNSGLPAVRRHLNSYLRWQEASSFIIQTDFDTLSGTSSIQSAERMRITSTGALRLNQGRTGINPLIDSNLTRVAISHLGSLPVTKPMSLLHLGYNTGAFASQVPNLPNPIGWRKWMELGMYVSNRQNNVFLGLKPENVGEVINNSARMDAVLAWGATSQRPNADYFRIIFTGDSLDANEPAETRRYKGAEMLRIYPGFDNIYDPTEFPASYAGLDSSYGRVGIGDFTTLAGNIPTEKLDVVGNGRFRFLPDSSYLADDNVKRVVMVDSNGVLRWSSNLGSGFVPCSDTVGGKLVEHSKINLNDNNLYFTNGPQNQAVSDNKLVLGYPCGFPFVPGKITVKQLYNSATQINSNAGYFENYDIASIVNRTFTGVYGMAKGMQTLGLNVSLPEFTENIGGKFYAANAGKNYSVYGTATGTVGTNYGAYFLASGAALNYGVYSSSPNNGINKAGYYLGALESSVPGTVTSDQQFKEDVIDEKNALEKIQKLRPVTYKLKTTEYPQFNFNDRVQHGFLAQEIGDVMPELVFDSYHPGEVDSLGNQISTPMSYKSLNYDAIISLNVQASKELFQIIQKQTLSDQGLKTNVTSLGSSLDKVIALRGVTFDWNYSAHPEMNFDSTTHIGFIAQEVNAVDPLLTFVDSDNYMHVDYDKVVPVVVESIEELNNKIETKDSIISALQAQVTEQEAQNTQQQSTIDDLNTRLSQLESCLSALLPTLCNMNQQAIQQNPQQTQRELKERLQVSLTDKNTIILSQNVPNPFAEQTVIGYSIPENVKVAQIHFYNSQGKLIQTVDLNERGNGELTVFANDLSSGIYTYSLVADGKVVATKKMMKK